MAKRGFTLIELLVTVSIMAILMAIGIASYATVNVQSRNTKRKSDVEGLRSALEMYRADVGSYPAVNPQGFDVATNLSDALTVQGDYLPDIPPDPMPSLYRYYYTPTDYDAANSKYYGYCLCAYIEHASNIDSNCEANVTTTQCNYGRRNP